MDSYEKLIARIVSRGGLVAALGGIDSGKTTFCKTVATVACRVGRSIAYLDCDVGQSTVGPPTTIGLKYLTSEEDLEPASLAQADSLYFVGSVNPQGHLLPMVVGTFKLAEQARAQGAELIVVDTTGLIGGTLGQALQLHKLEALRPDWVVGFQRGEELEPILGAVRRSLPAEVESMPVARGIRPTSVDERVAHRQAALKAAFAPPLHRWRVKQGVLIPQVPPDVDLSLLDGVLVGMDDGKGNCLGLGILECKDGSLRMISSVAEGAKALRIGSTRVTPDFLTARIDLRDLFVSD